MVILNSVHARLKEHHFCLLSDRRRVDAVNPHTDARQYIQIEAWVSYGRGRRKSRPENVRISQEISSRVRDERKLEAGVGRGAEPELVRAANVLERAVAYTKRDSCEIRTTA